MSTGITFTIDAEPGLSEASVMIDGSLLTTRESSPGKYVSSTTSPSKPGTYPVTVSLKNLLGQVFSKDSALILGVTEDSPPSNTAKFKNVQALTE